MDNSEKTLGKFIGAMVVNLFIAGLLELIATELKIVIPSYIYSLMFFFLLSVYVIVFLIKEEYKTGIVKLIPLILLTILIINIVKDVKTMREATRPEGGYYQQYHRSGELD